MAIARRLAVPYSIYTHKPELVGPAGRRICKGALEDVVSHPVLLVTDTGAWPSAAVIQECSARKVLIVRDRYFDTFDERRFDEVFDATVDAVLIRQPEEWLSVAGAQKVVGTDHPVLAYHVGKSESERKEIWRRGEEVAARLDKPLVIVKGRYPVCELLPGAGRVVCAAGYNSYAETLAWGGPVSYFPMLRDLDDQVRRLSWRPRSFEGARLAAELIHEQTKVTKVG